MTDPGAKPPAHPGGGSGLGDAPPPERCPARGRARQARAVAAPFLALSLASAAAIFAQDFAGALPLGIANEARAAYAALSAAALALAVAAASIFAHELAGGRATRAGALARGSLVSLLLLEALVTALDLAWVSRPDAPGPALGGPYREAVSSAGTRVFLKRPHEGSPLGFRSEAAHAKDVPRRVLFLGDSYTEGSGRRAACNYPEVAVATLNARLAARGEAPFASMNAGVAGYGPADSVALLRFLREEGYRFDAAVLSLFVENDFTDDLPGTERRVVAGMNFRFPRSPLLRFLHPMNARSARYAMFVWRASRLGRADDAVLRGDGACRPPPPLPAELPPPLRELVLRRFEANYGREARLATGEVAGALAAFAREARDAGAAPFVVVFPDRIAADRELRERLGLADLPSRRDLASLRRFVAEHASGAPVIDATDALASGAENYRPSDTHLSDVGNVAAGRFVGDRLAELLSSAPAPRRSSGTPLGARRTPAS